jgi:TolA-binding protein
LAISLFIAGCYNIKSVRQNNKKDYIRSVKKNDEKNDKAINETFISNTKDDNKESKSREFNNKSNNINSNDASINAVSSDSIEYTDLIVNRNTDKIINTSNRLPTLREQMKALSDEQTEIKNDISDIRIRLNEIALALDYLKTGKEPMASKGNDNNNTSFEGKNDISTKNAQSIILSDEVVGEKETKSYENLLINKKPNKNMSKAPVNNTSTKNNSYNNIKERIEKINSVDLTEALRRFEQKDYIGTIDKLNQILKYERNPTTISNCHYWLAESFFNMQKYSEALKHYQKSLKSASGVQLIKSQIMIAESYNKIGEKSKARDVYRKVVDNYPQSDYVPHALKMLQKL